MNCLHLLSSMMARVRSLYYKLGLQLDFRSRDGSARAMFFYRGSVEGYSQSPAETVEGLGPGALKIMVKAALGPPDESGETGTGDGAGVWFWYKRGIQFNFNKEDITDVMAIFDPEMSIEEQLL